MKNRLSASLTNLQNWIFPSSRISGRQVSWRQNCQNQTRFVAPTDCAIVRMSQKSRKKHSSNRCTGPSSGWLCDSCCRPPQRQTAPWRSRQHSPNPQFNFLIFQIKIVGKLITLRESRLFDCSTFRTRCSCPLPRSHRQHSPEKFKLNDSLIQFYIIWVQSKFGSRNRSIQIWCGWLLNFLRAWTLTFTPSGELSRRLSAAAMSLNVGKMDFWKEIR